MMPPHPFESAEGLRAFFADAPDRKLERGALVPTAVRNRFLLRSPTAVRRGRHYRVVFKTQGGGLWRAHLASLEDLDAKAEGRA